MSNGKPPVIVNGQLQMPKLSLRQRTSAALLGVKGSLLRSQSKEKVGREENPVARLKLLLGTVPRTFPSSAFRINAAV
jgi:hydroxymethylglutaryl-CoA reductase (NADPH)